MGGVAPLVLESPYKLRAKRGCCPFFYDSVLQHGLSPSRIRHSLALLRQRRTPLVTGAPPTSRAEARLPYREVFSLSQP
jgi:hypothetical protein